MIQISESAQTHFRKLIERESQLPPWRELFYVLRRLEARGVEALRGGATRHLNTRHDLDKPGLEWAFGRLGLDLRGGSYLLLEVDIDLPFLKFARDTLPCRYCRRAGWRAAPETRSGADRPSGG